jgi:outer membrane protein assembly factor BamB
MGHVFLGFSPAGRAVAVKVIHPQLAADPAFRVRFGREVAAAQAVSGAYTAPVVAAGPDDEPPWLATLFVAGPSLAEAVAAAGPLPTGPAWRLAVGLAEALVEIHGHGLIHRDLKPANVLLAMDGPRVIDFGISRALEATVMTATGLVVGTPSFMSPEQAAGGQVTPSSDVFSLGCVLVFAATGSGPFGNGPVPSLLYRVVHAEPALGAVPAGLRELAAACLAKDPASRPTPPQVMATITADSRPLADSLASFWPDTVAGLIRAHQSRLDAQLAQPPARKPTMAPPTPPPYDEPTATAPRDEPTATGQPAAAAAALAATADVLARALPADLARSGRARGPRPTESPRPTGPAIPTGRAVPGLTRRRVLAGLAGAAAAAGLATAGWQLTRGSAPPGTELWRTGTGNGLALFPVVGDGVVYLPDSGGFLGNLRGGLFALNASDGTTLWSTNVGGGAASSPEVSGGVIFYVDSNDTLHALRAGNGQPIWSSGIGDGTRTDPAVAEGVVYVGGNDNRMRALHAGNGQPIWTISIDCYTDPVVADGVIYVGSYQNTVNAVRADSGHPIWTADIGIYTDPAPVGDVVYAGTVNGRLYALRVGDGHPIWTTSVDGGVPRFTVAGGIVYVGGYRSPLQARRAADGHLIWTAHTFGGLSTYPAVAGDAVYVGGYDHLLHALRVADGGQIWASGIGGGPSPYLSVAGNVIYFLGRDSRLHALRD